MYPTRIALMFAANITVTCPWPCFFNHLVTPCIWLDITQDGTHPII